jgi:hypothetical protein
MDGIEWARGWHGFPPIFRLRTRFDGGILPFCGVGGKEKVWILFSSRAKRSLALYGSDDPAEEAKPRHSHGHGGADERSGVVAHDESGSMEFDVLLGCGVVEESNI